MKQILTGEEARIFRRISRRLLDNGGRIESRRVKSRLLAFCRRVSRDMDYFGYELDKGKKDEWFLGHVGRSMKEVAVMATTMRKLIAAGKI